MFGKRRPMTEAEKALRGEKSRLWWATDPKAQLLKEKQRQRRIEYNKTKVDERLSPEARKKASERLTLINQTRERPEVERKAASGRAKNNKNFRRGSMKDAEKEAIRQRMIGNTFGSGQVMSAELKARHSARMTTDNPMRVPEIAEKTWKTRRERYGEDSSSQFFKKLWREGRAHARTEFSEAERLAISERMKSSNPMKDPAVVEKVMASISQEVRTAASERMKRGWAEGKFTPSMYRGIGNVKSANKTELKLFPMLRHFHGRFVGDGKFWLRLTASGICRNPDFIFGSGKNKTALLVHGVYWHRDEETNHLEIEDYRRAGWHLFVLWTKRIQNWMMPSIKGEIVSWLAEARSSPSETPVIRQFMTWNATRTTTS
jgi:hypothetical protein